ncbi:MGH1-like glycoside hydrolase domain-containing protein [Chondromyces apiculatus]|uniref:Six-hairpin glycosidase-like protein n=1 Tax=Chondromyces apiculatus DSM 436 TaxID=1192034 RepID=A0A017SVM5_9BACT|nr:hypothetical protein [Chondromyces apiculatus]EYF00361.1 Six-hairpin glycosidase-like protein [Chondromyces apiculatus DSM 436]
MRSLRSPLALSFCALAVLAAAGCGDDLKDRYGSSTTTTTTTTTGTSAGGGGSGGADGQGGAGGAGGSGGEAPIASCVPAVAQDTAGGDRYEDGQYEASVVVQDAESCARSYVLSTTGPVQENIPATSRPYAERPGQPVVRTGHAMFDAIYAMAVEEARENSVDAISDYAFNGGAAIPCPAGGCFETGQKWNYVWTRDTAYAVALGLGQFDPTRAKNSLQFKISTRRDGSRPEIVQDTGSGGSWPISTDRVVWAIGAKELLNFLDGQERAAFRDLAYPALVNTAERDRQTIWDPADGLYRGEQSFLDWREQTYPAYTATDTVQIAMSKALSTNIGHMVMLQLAAQLAEEKGDATARARYEGWAEELREAIRARLWLEDHGLFSTFIPGPLDPAPTTRFDLLGSAFAVLYDVATPEQAGRIVASYPHLPKGAPVAWPQQQDTPIYHNRGIWPFVSAFWARAAAKAGNAEALENSVHALLRGAALNLSHMENFEMVTGLAHVDEGTTSGPVVNSPRQLWSVGGHLGVVNEVLFGLEATPEGVRFHPKITGGLRTTLFEGAERITLSNLRYRGKNLSVAVDLPANAGGGGLLEVLSVRLNGQEIEVDALTQASELAADNLFEVTLGPGGAAPQGITFLDDATLANYRNLFGPRPPSLSGGEIASDRIQLAWTFPEDAAGVTFNVHRDGALVASGLPGTTTTWQDPDSGAHATRTYCYTVEATYTVSGTVSQRTRPWCYWGTSSARVQTFGAQGFTAIGGALVNNHGHQHYEDWGDPGDSLTVINVTPSQSGKHLIQALAANGAGPYNTGITCGVKALEVWQGATLVGGGQLVMPHQGQDWSQWRDSNLVAVNLTAGQSYTLVIREDERSGNMSDLGHFLLYNNMGGASGRFNKVNIAEVKLLSLGTP